ncbi:DUF624 domain-containing protein [Niallia sp.]|uniref:DUF624 domain-containing protein n=1 Tax=Niallia sp. TaxID=2837523 RepID=UPI00289A3F08|nr:DUF624 domain-containing protein [Niallia sp.]
MEQKKEFGQGILFTFSNYIYWILLTNIYFVATNALFIFFFMTLTPSFSNIGLYALALIPSGPAISGLFYSMEKLVRTKELSPTADFFYGYRSNLKGTFFIWTIILAIYFVLLIDLQYLRITVTPINQIIFVVLLVLTLIWTMLSINMLIINSRFTFRIRDLVKLSAYYQFIKLKETLGNILILFLVAFATVITTDFLVVFIASLIAMIMMFNSRAMLNHIESNFLKKSSSNNEGETCNTQHVPGS